MWSLLRTRRWIAFSILVVVAIAAFGLLSRWQWQRAEERRAERTELAAQASTPVVGLVDAAAAPVEWSPIRVAGRFDDAGTVLVRQRPLDGRNGFWVVSPLDSDAGRVWVNRGWIPATGAATGLVVAPEAPVGDVIVEGRVRLAEDTLDPAPADLPSGQVATLSPSALPPSALGADITGMYIEATASDPADPSVMRLPAPVIDETRNISYAVQWLVFAAVAILGWWFFLRREAREDAAKASTADAGAGG